MSRNTAQLVHLVLIGADAGQDDVIFLTALEAVHGRHLNALVQGRPQRAHLHPDPRQALPWNKFQTNPLIIFLFNVQLVVPVLLCGSTNMPA